MLWWSIHSPDNRGTEMTSPFHAPIAEQIWDAKYRFKEADGTPIDQTVEDTWRRIAEALTAKETSNMAPVMAGEFYEALEDFRFLTAGRITAGAGTGRMVTLFNCYVMGTIPDSLNGIFEMLKEAALTMQQGGGIGYDFSTLRPKGALVKKLGADASGPLSFMDCWDSMCRTIMSAGSRRGAMMGTMRCDHPDIRDFITAKQDSTRFRMFNLSVLVTDDFMKAVEDNADWPLHFDGKVYEVTKARELWDLIMKSTYDYAEPGVIFIDRINNDNNLRYCETISATNPCGEQPLPPYGACLLGSVNMAKMVDHPFEKNASINMPLIKETVARAVRMMDNVVDVSNFPLPQQQQEAYDKRRLGLGVTGVADMLIMLGVTYGSDEAVAIMDELSRKIALAAYWASVELAKEKGAFPKFNADGYLASGTFAQRLCEYDPDLEAAIRKHGIRNSHLTSIAPTGTISLYAGNVSSGIEPVFAYEYTRKVLQKDGSKTEELVQDYAVRAYQNWLGDSQEDNETLPDYFVSAQTLPPAAHLKMQAAAQKWVDSSISKTINLPEDISFEDFKEVYWRAYEMGCKGCTTYRPNDVTGSVLSVEPKKKEEVKSPLVEADFSEIEMRVLAQMEPTPRPETLDGSTYKLKYGMDSIYITITDIEENGQVRPFEVFINSKNVEHFAWTIGMARMISAIFRRPHDSRFVVQELKEVFDPKGGQFMKGKYVPSMLAAIGGIIENHMKRIGYIEGKEVSMTKPTADEPPVMGTIKAPKACPNCHGYNFKSESGCEVCVDCGHSKCG